jgi:hypothetical protein
MKAAFTNLFAALPNVLFSSKFFEIVNIRTFDIRTPDIRGGGGSKSRMSMDQIQFSVDRSRSNWSAFFGGGGDAFSSA